MTPPRPPHSATGSGDLDQTGELLERFLTASGTEPMAPEVRAFVANNPGLVRAAEALRASWQADLAELPVNVPVPVASQQGELPTDATHGMTSVPVRTGWSQPAARTRLARVARLGALTVAASACVAAAVFIVQSRPHHVPLVQRYSTANGERATVELSDGTRVVLNAASTLLVPDNFRAGHRTVRLLGEALFTVVHRDGEPFTIVAGSARTTVLGTQFGVRAYGSVVRVAVRDGRVSVGQTILGARDVAEIPAHGQVTVVHDVNVADNLAFATGTLVLSGAPLRDAVADLNRWYDADVRFGDSAIGARQLRANLPAGTRGDLMQILQQTLRARVVRDGRVITVFTQ